MQLNRRECCEATEAQKRPPYRVASGRTLRSRMGNGAKGAVTQSRFV